MFEPTAGRLQLDINSLLVNVYNIRVPTEQGKQGKTGKMANKNSLQGKLREFENFAKLGEFQSDIFLNLLIFILLNYDMECMHVQW